MRNSSYLWVLVLLFSYNSAFLQTADNPHGIAARAAFHNFQWPLKTVNVLRLDDFSSGFEFEYYRFLTEQLNISFPLRISNGLLVIDESGTTYKAGSMGLDALLNFKLIDDGWLRPHVFAGAGVFIEDMKEISAVIPIGMGLNFQLGRNSFLTTTAAYKIGLKDFRDHLQIGAGLRFNIAPKKKEEKIATGIDKNKNKDVDGDGIIDTEDLCPELAGLAALNGCPDADGDGLTDANDHCPNIAGLKILNGCPDTDNDGLIDTEDDCPKRAGPVSNSGCPLSDISDMEKIDQTTPIAVQVVLSDQNKTNNSVNTIVLKNNDNTIDTDHSNPLVTTPINNIPPNQTATYSDIDGDGVADDDDRCPTLKGTITNSGCPAIEATDIEILEDAIQAIEFETASAIITKDSYSVLDGVSAVMYRNTAYKLNIDGHTDSIGSSKANQFLSERRALACFNYLLTKGVAPSRMNYSGFGESLPINSNKFAQGRELNRRVEFSLILD